MECGIVAERHKLAIFVKYKETHTTFATAHCNSTVGRNSCFVRSCNISITLDEIGYGTIFGTFATIPKRTWCYTIVFNRGFACSVVDEQNCIVLFVALFLYRGNSSLYLFFGYVVYTVAVVAHKAVVHNLEETVSAEELGQVLTGSIASVLIETEQRGLTAYLSTVHQRHLAAKFEQTGPELCVVTSQVVVEPQTVIQMGDSPNVVCIKVVAIGIERTEHARQRTLATIDTRCSHTHIPNGYVREEVVGNLGLSVEIEDTLVLVTNLVRRSPSGACLVGNDTNNTTHCVVVVVTYTPTTAHITARGANCCTVVVIVIAVVAVLAELLICLCNAINRSAAIVIYIKRSAITCPSRIQVVHLVNIRLAQKTHCSMLAVHDAVPSLKHDVYCTIFGIEVHFGIIGVAIITKGVFLATVTVGSFGNLYIFKPIGKSLLYAAAVISNSKIPFLGIPSTEVEKQCLTVAKKHKVAAKGRTLLVVVPILVVVDITPKVVGAVGSACPVVTHCIEEAVDVATLYVNFQGGKIGQFIRECLGF